MLAVVILGALIYVVIACAAWSAWHDNLRFAWALAAFWPLCCVVAVVYVCAYVVFTTNWTG